MSTHRVETTIAKPATIDALAIPAVNAALQPDAILDKVASNVDHILAQLVEHKERLESEQKYNRLSLDKAKRAYISGELNTIRWATNAVEEYVS